MASGFCDQCGAARGDADRFCPSCGAELAAPKPTRRGWPWRRTLLIGLPLLGLLAAGAVAAWVLLDDAPEDDAIALVPAQADYYVTAHLSPSLGQKRSVKEVLDRAREAGASDASTDSIEDLIADLVEDGTPLSYRRDVEPQLGDQVALFGLDPSEGGEDEGAVLIATKDEQASLAAMREVMEAEYGDGSWRGEGGWRIVQRKQGSQPYEVAVPPEDWGDDDALAFTIVDGFVVVGVEPAILASLAARGGESLADTERFATVRDRLSDDVLAFAYVGGKAMADAWDGYGYDVPDSLKTGDEPVGVTLAAGDGQIVVDVAASSPLGGDQPFVAGSELLRSLPADAIAAASLGDLGTQLGAALEEDNELMADLQDSLDEETDLDVERDLASWLGSAGLYFAGSSTDSVEGALVAETRSSPDSDRVLGELQELAEDNADSDDYDSYFDDYGTSVEPAGDGSGFDMTENGDTVYVRGDDDRVVAGMGASGFDPDGALDADGGFGDSPAYKTAAGALGGGFDPFLVLDAPPIEQLIAELASDSGDDSYFDDAQPWLESVETVAGGVRDDDGGVELRFVVGLRDDGSAPPAQGQLSGE